jgi:hypothetical protein
VRLLIALALLVLPVAALVIAYVLPTIRTITMSFQDYNLLDNPAPVDGDNYRALIQLLDALAALIAPTLAMILAGAVIAPLIAWCVHRAGAATRTAARVLWSATAVLFAPAAMTAAWTVDRMASEYTPPTVLDWVPFVSGLALGAGALAALAAFRGGSASGRTASTVVTTAGLVALAATAATLQTFTFATMTGLRPNQVPLMLVYTHGFNRLQFGHAAATSTVLLAILAALGIAAALLVALTRLRIEVTPDAGEPRRFRPLAGIAAILLLTLTGSGVIVNLWPWLTRMGGTGRDAPYPASELMFYTWVPALLTTALAVIAAAAGGFAIGALRPLGDQSRWLLMPFAPWLFVGTGPLVLAHYDTLRDAGGLGYFSALPPRAWIAVPALFVFTALFWGLEDRRRQAAAQGLPRANLAVARGAWPMVALVAMAVWLVNANDSFWQIVNYDHERPTAFMAASMELQMHMRAGDVAGLGYPMPFLVAFGSAAVLLAVFYLPRLAIRTGR